MIGIDLGTTNSLVSVFLDGAPSVLANEAGETLTPSAVAVAEDGTLLVGRAARDRLISEPDAGRAFFKRDMGGSASYYFGGRTWTPVECSAVVLKEMKRIAEMRLGHPVGEAVITVPAYFHDPQRQATLAAAEIAGLRVKRLVNEPTAAALAYGFHDPGMDSTLLVFDLGGGTFDVTVLEVFDGVVEVKATAGESRLGGEDYTDALAMWIASEHGWSMEDAQRERWRSHIDRLKKELATAEKGKVQLGEKEIEVTRRQFEEATRDITARLRPVVRRCLRDARISPTQLSAVLLVGGASRMPMVRSLIHDDLGPVVKADLDPDRVVALGAAVQQALVNEDAAVRDLVLTDVCSHTLGVSVAKWLAPGQTEPGYFDPIIDRNSTVPVSRAKTFSTLHPLQDEVRIEVFQGESRRTAENTLIGEMAVRGLKAMPGQEKPGAFDVRFTYDMSGLLEVEITILETQQKVAKVFEQRPGQMTTEEIAAAIRRLQPLKVHPRDLPVHRARLERANRLFAELSGPLRQELSQHLDVFEMALASADNAGIQTAGATLDRFMSLFFKGEEPPAP